jgi:hypothetical protein
VSEQWASEGPSISACLAGKVSARGSDAPMKRISVDFGDSALISI